MPHTVEAVEEEGECEESLESRLDSHWPSSNCRDHRLRLHMPSSVGGNQVCDTEEVEGAGQGDASNTVERRRNPGDLGPVDGKVGRDGAVDALLCEDLSGFRLRGVFGCCESTRCRQSGCCYAPA